MIDESEAVLEFWFGALDSSGGADEFHARRWFAGNDEFDELVRERFAAVHTAVASGERDEWLASARGRLATIVVLDQLSRNLYRESERMYAFDDKALQTAKEGVHRGFDRSLHIDERVFFYMPFMHSEDIAMQERGVELFTELDAEASPALRERTSEALRFAKHHHDIIHRFGRFPHRNTLLGRPATPHELEFMKEQNLAL